MINRVQGALLSWLALVLVVVPAVRGEVSPGSVDDDDDGRPGRPSEYVTPGWVVVKFKNSVAIPTGASKTGISAVDGVAERYELQSVQKMFPMLDRLSASKAAALKGMEGLHRVFKMEIDENEDPFRVAAALQALPEVEYAEPLFREKITRYSSTPSWFEQAPPLLVIPNDPIFEEQSHLTHISAPEAWDVIKSESGNVLISVIDGGTDWKHQDLQTNVFVNPDEIPDNNIDDDGNSLIDDVNGWNFANDSPDPEGLTATPVNATHGTQTAGIATAITNNGTGIAGMSWNATLLPVNISCPETDNSLCFSYNGILYSMIMDADIVSASFGGPFRSALFQDLIDTAAINGTLVVAAAGNEGQNSDLNPSYPASYDHVLSVCWTGKNFDSINASSNFGITVDTCAPGSSINVTSPNNTYTTASGSSFSTPLAAGVAALVRALHPDWTVDQVREQVRVTSDDISDRNNTIRYRGKIGKGRVNAFRAVTESSPSVRVLNASILDAGGSNRIGPGESATVFVELINYLESISDLDITLESSSNFVTIGQSSFNLTSLGTNETAQVSFSVTASPDVPFNEKANLVLRMESGSYTDADATSVIVNSTNHNTGIVELSLTEEGNLGWEEFQGESDGNGFRYRGTDYLFEGGLIMASGPGKVSDNVRTDDTAFEVQENDFVRIEASNFGIDDGRVTAEEGALELNDSNADAPNNIRIRLDSYADTSEAYHDFVVLRYTIDNTGTTPVNNFHAGLFFDWDSDDPGNDQAGYDAARRMGIFRDGPVDAASIFIGAKILSENATPNYRSIDNVTELFEDGFTKAEKWSFVSGGVQTQTLTGTDVSMLISGGPYTIDPGASIEIAFALVGGLTEEELQGHADAAQLLWDQSLKSLGPNPVSVEDPEVQPAFSFALSDPFPNPLREVATIQYEIPVSGAVALTIYDMLGREVRSLVSETVRAGKHALTWDARDNSGRAVASGVYMVSLTSPSNEGLKTATRKVVVLR